MADYLNKNAKFKCAAGKTFNIVVIPKMVSGAGSELLTTSDMLQMMPCTCPLIPNPPISCAMTAPCSNWSPGSYSETFKIAGKPVLKKSSMMMMCPLTSTPIRCDSSGVDGKVCVGASASQSSSTKSESKADNKPNKSDSDSAGGNNSSVTSAQAVSEGNGGSDSHTTGTENGTDVETDKQSGDIEGENEEEQTSPDDLYCQYNPEDEKCKKCEYIKKGTTVNSSSSILSDNYKDFFEKNSNDKMLADIHYDELVGTYAEVNWTYAAHHIICGNQIYNKYPKLVKLGNFCNYDINNAKNCIMLLTLFGNKYPSDAGTEEKKSIFAYKCMKNGQAQWHVGHHDYGKFGKTDIDMMKKQIRIYTGRTPEEIKDYVAVVSEEMDNLVSELEADKSSLCWASDEQKKCFRNILDSISSDVKMKLGKFTEKPHRSYPYFVSQESYRYAFNVPRSSKIMLIDWRDGKLILNKVVAVRFADEMQKQGTDLDFHESKSGGGSRREYYFNNRKKIVDCIYFVGEYTNFVVLSSEGEKVLKTIFPLEHVLDLSGKIIDDYHGVVPDNHFGVLSRYDSEILVWLRNIKCWNNEQQLSGNAKARERLAKWGGLQ